MMANEQMQMPPETIARIKIGKFIRKFIFTEDYQKGRLSKKKLFKILNSHIRYTVAPESGLSPYYCNKLANEIFSLYLQTEEYQAYVELVREARQNHMTPDQYFNAIMIKQVEQGRGSIDGMEGYGGSN